MARRVKKSSKKSWFQLLASKLNGNSVPLVISFLVIGVSFVLIRMKGVEQDYKLNDLEKRVKVQTIKNKELKAERARELSMKKLKSFSKKYGLSEPDEKRIIIIPKS